MIRYGEINKPLGDWPKDRVDGIHEEEGGLDHYEVCPQQGVEAMKDAMHGLICTNSSWKAWDDLTNVELCVEDLKAARVLEMEYFLKMMVLLTKLVARSSSALEVN